MSSGPLFGERLRPELDPAQLLDELRATRPLIDQIVSLEALINALNGMNVGQVQEFRRAMQEHESIMARLESADAQLHRIEELLALLDELEVIVRRQ